MSCLFPYTPTLFVFFIFQNLADNSANFLSIYETFEIFVVVFFQIYFPKLSKTLQRYENYSLLLILFHWCSSRLKLVKQITTVDIDSNFSINILCHY